MQWTLTTGRHMQDAGRDAESDSLQKPKGQEAARQVKVDKESAALQKPETQEAVKQVEVDSESAQLQKPETQEVMRPKTASYLLLSLCFSSSSSQS